jgi:hypothetical protein
MTSMVRLRATHDMSAALQRGCAERKPWAQRPWGQTQPHSIAANARGRQRNCATL